MRPFQLLRESVSLSISFLISNKLRSFLSILGVTIGIFCIVAITTATHSLEKNIRQSVDKLGDRIVYIQKWPWGFGGSYQWWDYLNRPEASIREYKQFESESNKDLVRNAAFSFEYGGNKLKTPSAELTDVKLVAVMGDFFEINKWELTLGRPYTKLELDRGKSTTILGYNVALNLFEGKNPIGKKLKVNGHKVTVIGVLELQGQAIGGQQYDDVMVLPGVFAQRFKKPNMQGVSSAIIVKGWDEVELKMLDFEIKRIMRPMRKLKPKDKDNFAINKLTMVSDNLSQTFGIIDLVAIVIGGFSLLVGGFGIANIMFVSVKERTSIIGLQKALGAKRRFIITQFLFEAVFLCILGALIGIGIVLTLGTLASKATDFQIFFSIAIFARGIAVSVFIGLVAGLAPALMAAKMDPVEALRK